MPTEHPPRSGLSVGVGISGYLTRSWTWVHVWMAKWLETGSKPDSILLGPTDHVILGSVKVTRYDPEVLLLVTLVRPPFRSDATVSRAVPVRQLRWGHG